ncbi:MAG: YoaK family protein [Bdellovibrio sp.]
MLFGSESISHYTKSNITIWMLMAFQAGILNIGGFMACHRFVSHVTGFATFFGFELTQSEPQRAFGMLIVPLFFLVGVMVSGQLVDLRLKLHKKPKYYIVFGIIFALTLIIALGALTGFFGEFGEPLEKTRDYNLLMLLCLTCGIQNGTITTVSRSVIRTTHLTGITTDLGLGIVRIFNQDKLSGDIANEKKATLMRLGIIFFFGSGSILGGFVFDKFGHGGFLIPVVTSGFLFTTMFFYQVWQPRKMQEQKKLSQHSAEHAQQKPSA